MAVYEALFLIAIVYIIFLVYSWSLPKPLPGIAYDESAARSIFGSIPDILAHVRETGRLRTWFSSHNRRHNAALTQVWMRPLAKPTLFLADFQESQDILLRRNKEFDRGQRSLDLFAGPVPNHHISMTTSDPRYKENKKLIKDLMTPLFLQKVSAPQIHSKATALVNLWTAKSRIAQDRPFDAKEDISDVAIDIMQATGYGLDDSMSIVKRQLDYLANLKESRPPLDGDGSVQFPRPPPVPAMIASYMIGQHVGRLFKSLFPRALHRFKVLTSASLRKTIAMKDALICSEINKALVRLHSSKGDEIHSAMDSVLQREMDLAGKEMRKPNFHSRAIYDELLGYVVAGYDTSASALSWMVKHIAEHELVQTKLRPALWAAYAAARLEDRQPSASEISETPIPYLDAVLEEVLRLNSPLGAQIRESTVDTELLGHRIPKGTSVFMIGTGPDFLSPSIPIPDNIRSETSRTKYSYGKWDPGDMDLFKPERWMKIDKDGHEVFDRQSGPFLSFGLGPRGCSGRRLAYLELRVVLVLLLWNFKFHQLSGRLSSQAATDGMTTNPKFCHVRLSKA